MFAQPSHMGAVQSHRDWPCPYRAFAEATEILGLATVGIWREFPAGLYPLLHPLVHSELIVRMW